MTEHDVFTMPGRLRWARAKWGISQAELADRAGVGKNTIYRAEQGLFELRFETARRVADALYIRWEWLVTGDGPTMGGEHGESDGPWRFTGDDFVIDPAWIPVK